MFVANAEIKAAIFHLDSDKVPGLDGFSGIFYQCHWDIDGSSLYQGVYRFFETCFLLREMNQTNIVLIPNCPNLIGIHQFHPISLYNFAYKVISKVMVNRLKPWMVSLIPPDQTAFIPS